MADVNKVRIALSGAHGVGKTTLCDQLTYAFSDAFPNATIVRVGNISRDLIAQKKVKPDVNSSLDDYYVYIAEYVKRLLNANGEYILHDRTLIDAMAYICYNKNYPEHFWEMLVEVTKLYTSQIDIYFYIPIEFPLVPDGVRRIDEQYQRAIDNLIVNSLESLGVPYIELRGDLNHRIESSVACISNYCRENRLYL